jgi:hypothetical protein
MPAIFALKKLRQEDLKFEAILDYKVKPCLRKQNKKTLIQQAVRLWLIPPPSANTPAPSCNL